MWKTMFRLEEMETKGVKNKKSQICCIYFIKHEQNTHFEKNHQGKPSSRNGGDKKAARGDGQHDIICLKKKRDDPLSETIYFFLSQKNLQVILADTVDSQLAKNMAVFVIYLYNIIVIAIIMIIIFSAIIIITIISTAMVLLFKVRKRSRQDMLAKKEALDLDVASLRLNDNSVPHGY